MGEGGFSKSFFFMKAGVRLGLFVSLLYHILMLVSGCMDWVLDAIVDRHRGAPNDN